MMESNDEKRVSSSSSKLHPASLVQPAICIELVGDRFLRQMVRRLVSTAVRECLKEDSIRNDNVLVDICLSGDRLVHRT
jgi:tRNA U38,U39,U40 pseudouridine synthase TruA